MNGLDSMDTPRHYTLLEITIVVLLVGLVLGLAIPRIGVIPGSIRVSQTFTAVNSGFHTAGMLAVATGHVVRAVVDPENCELRVEAAALPVSTGDEEPTETGPPFPAVEAFTFAADTTVATARNEPLDPESGPPVYVFYPSGEATGPPLRLAVAGRTFTLDVDRLTGKALVEEQD